MSYLDGSVLAQLAHPDMKIPIAYTLSAKQNEYKHAAVRLIKSGLAEFHDPDKDKFPVLRLARERQIGRSACLANAANEIAVAEFLAENTFTDIEL